MLQLNAAAAMQRRTNIEEIRFFDYNVNHEKPIRSKSISFFEQT